MIITPKQKEKKKEYVEILRRAFVFDERSGVLDMRYEVIDMPDVYEENVKIFFETHAKECISISAGRCMADELHLPGVQSCELQSREDL